MNPKTVTTDGHLPNRVCELAPANTKPHILAQAGPAKLSLPKFVFRSAPP
jgi:hypothetical protein